MIVWALGIQSILDQLLYRHSESELLVDMTDMSKRHEWLRKEEMLLKVYTCYSLNQRSDATEVKLEATLPFVV